MGLLIPFIGFTLLAALYKLYQRVTRISIARVPGPEPESFLLGNLPEYFQSQAGEADFKWQAEYGDVVRLKAPFGEDRLLISDPKALQYVYQTSGYNFSKQPERRELSRVVSGRGILWAEADDHKRHRKVMLPGFSGPEAKGFASLFSAKAAKLGEKWKDIIASSPDQSSVLDMPSWTSRATLDAIGEAAFDYEFGAMENADNALGKAYMNLPFDTFGTLTRSDIFLQNFLGYIPDGMRELFVDYLPSKKLTHARSTAKLATGVARALVDSKSAALLHGKGNKDIMTLLVKANASEDEKTQLNEEELLAQMRTLILAGHETTANTLSWMLLELARHTDVQTKLRHEIRATRQTLQARGDVEFKSSDYDAMPYLTAFVKESLRIHPVAITTFRQAVKDDVLPLSKPITTTSGEVITELPIPKGQKIITSINGYNRNKDIFGEDAHVFDPNRWLHAGGIKKAAPVGVLGNLMTFAAGIRSCIGWKFAVVELQAFLVELVGGFEFSLTPDAMRIRRESALVMVPTIEGQVEKGAQLPLRVRVASREEI
ncbi:Leukotriene-B4 omega-hydroxylase 3 [Hypsizygus marmoreus]|uniref:Leukotriene-B4 omega-hydroxylase 3 n=1 Tax=Hypsizygus marmoreus TaxID=39966 RepID=A0A369K2D4_HYPMA|nr:Leukotriene-B4 omega-hydroxylase 3 [Hypsizygus marmoreus]